MCENNKSKSKHTTLSAVYLIIFIIFLIILPYVFSFVFLMSPFIGFSLSTTMVLILFAHLIFLVPILPQRKLNKKIFIFELGITAIFFIKFFIVSVLVIIGKH